jgi:TolA-binding protein
MSIDDGFRLMLAGIRQADEGRDEIMRGLEAAWAGRKDLDEQLRELQESVSQLQHLVLEQGADLRRLREQLNGGDA